MSTVRMVSCYGQGSASAPGWRRCSMRSKTALVASGRGKGSIGTCSFAARLNSASGIDHRDGLDITPLESAHRAAGARLEGVLPGWHVRQVDLAHPTGALEARSIGVADVGPWLTVGCVTDRCSVDEERYLVHATGRLCLLINRPAANFDGTDDGGALGR